MTTNFDPNLPEFIESRVLNAKFEQSVAGAAVLDHLIEHQPEAFGVEMQNVCAKMPRPFVEEMEKRLDLLGMNKREFITYAVHYALNMVDAEVERRGLIEYLYPEADPKVFPTTKRVRADEVA